MTKGRGENNSTGGDILRLERMIFEAHHGCTRSEREEGATFTVDVEFLLDLKKAAAGDDLAKTINVAEAYVTVSKIVLGPSRNLVETVAEEIASTLLARFGPKSVRVVVHKDRAPMPGPTEGYEVEIVRP